MFYPRDNKTKENISTNQRNQLTIPTKLNRSNSTKVNPGPVLWPILRWPFLPTHTYAKQSNEICNGISKTELLANRNRLFFYFFFGLYCVFWEYLLIWILEAPNKSSTGDFYLLFFFFLLPWLVFDCGYFSYNCCSCCYCWIWVKFKRALGSLCYML